MLDRMARCLGEHAEPSQAGHRQRTHAARLDEASHGRRRRDQHVNLTTAQIIDGRPGALVRHVLQRHAAVLVEHHGRQVQQRADAGRGVGELLRMCLGLCGQRRAVSGTRRAAVRTPKSLRRPRCAPRNWPPACVSSQYRRWTGAAAWRAANPMLRLCPGATGQHAQSTSPGAQSTSPIPAGCFLPAFVQLGG